MTLSTLRRNEEIVVPRCRVAKDFFSRFMGLMGKRGIAADEAVIFPRCNSIHTFFMRFPIDVVMVSDEGQVVAVVPSMGAWRLLMPKLKAKHTIELQAGRIAALDIRVGQTLSCEGAWS